MKVLIKYSFIAFITMGLLACKHELSQPVVVADDYVQQSSRHTKSGAAVSLVSSQVNLAVSGVEYAVDIDLNSQYASGSMELSVSTSDGLYIMSGHTNATLALTQGTISNPYRLIASETGRYYVYLNIKAQSGGQTSTRALTFIVQVGEVVSDTSSSSLKKATSSEDSVITLPAQEEIIY